jgi:hypothetical protein
VYSFFTGAQHGEELVRLQCQTSIGIRKDLAFVRESNKFPTV